MDIREFVSSSILQVMEGVADTQERARELGGYVNPTAHSLNANGGHIGITANSLAIYPIAFDIAVTVGGESGMEAGAKLQVASIVSIGGKGKSADKHETISRVKFSVSVTLPVDADSNVERDKRRAAQEERGRRESTAASNWQGT